MPIVLNSPSDLKDLVARAAAERYERFYRSCAMVEGRPFHTCLPRAVLKGQTPDAAVIVPAGMDQTILQKLDIPPGSAFSLTPTSPYLAEADVLQGMPHATWAGLQYAVGGLNVDKVIIFGSNDCLFEDREQFGGPARKGAEKIYNDVRKFLAGKGITNEAEVTELTARRIVVESVLNAQRGFSGSSPKEVWGIFVDRDGSTIRLDSQAPMEKTYENMISGMTHFEDAACPHLHLVSNSCSDSRGLGQHFIQDDGVLHNNSIAAIVAPYAQSHGGVSHPWKLIAHAYNRGVRYMTIKGHEDCGGSGALVRSMASGKENAPLIQNWIAQAEEPVRAVLDHAHKCGLFGNANDNMGVVADMAARAMTVWSAKNVMERYADMVCLPLHIQRDGSVLLLDIDDPLGQTAQPLFQASHKLEDVCEQHGCMSRDSSKTERLSLVADAIRRRQKPPKSLIGQPGR
ncbi:MAG: hypothetical protein KGI97_07780 [Alphaproteobacteria bacterium]|nr:hypothetical protein [Alphaproteobacteria bacterium]